MQLIDKPTIADLHPDHPHRHPPNLGRIVQVIGLTWVANSKYDDIWKHPINALLLGFREVLPPYYLADPSSKSDIEGQRDLRPRKRYPAHAFVGSDVLSQTSPLFWAVVAEFKTQKISDTRYEFTFDICVFCWRYGRDRTKCGVHNVTTFVDLAIDLIGPLSFPDGKEIVYKPLDLDLFQGIERYLMPEDKSTGFTALSPPTSLPRLIKSPPPVEAEPEPGLEEPEDNAFDPPPASTSPRTERRSLSPDTDPDSGDIERQIKRQRTDTPTGSLDVPLRRSTVGLGIIDLTGDDSDEENDPSQGFAGQQNSGSPPADNIEMQPRPEYPAFPRPAKPHAKYWPGFPEHRPEDEEHGRGTDARDTGSIGSTSISSSSTLRHGRDEREDLSNTASMMRNAEAGPSSGCSSASRVGSYKPQSTARFHFMPDELSIPGRYNRKPKASTVSRPAARLASPPELPGPAVASRANAYGSRLLQRPSSPPRELDADPIDRRIEDMLFGSARPVNRTDCTDKARLSPETAAPAVTVEAQNEELREKNKTIATLRSKAAKSKLSLQQYRAASRIKDLRINELRTAPETRASLAGRREYDFGLPKQPVSGLASDQQKRWDQLNARESEREKRSI